MVGFCLATLLLAPAAPVLVEAPVSGLSLFKNGYAVVVRRIPVSADGVIQTRPLAGGMLGTFWLAGTSGVRISEALTGVTASNTERNAANLDEVLTANLGQTIVVVANLGGANPSTLNGKLISVTGQTLIISSPLGTAAINKSAVISVNSTGELKYKVPTETSERWLRLQVTGAKKDSAVFTLSIERGATWAPAYNVDILNEKRLRVLARATVMNDLADLKGVEAKLITGFPNLAGLGRLDPFTSGQSVDQFLGWLQQNMPGGPGGGFGGAMMNQAPAPAAYAKEESMDMGVALPDGPVAGEQGEDLFFYPRNNLNLKLGERAYLELFQFEADYEQIFIWEIPDTVLGGGNRPMNNDGAGLNPDPVWNTLRFKNSPDQPLTTALAMTMRNGNVVGQDILHYTPRGASVDLRITQALDLPAESTEEETARQVGALRLENRPSYDLVTIEGTLRVSNRRGEAANLEILKRISGEVISAEGNPVTNKLATGLRDVNPRQSLKWKLAVGAGETKTLKYRYKLYVAN